VDLAPGPEPEPPDDLASRPLPLRTFDELRWFRGHRVTYGPLHFNTASGRFCAPDRISFGTLYLETDPRCAFLEAFARSLGSATAGYVVSQSVLDRSCLCVVTPTRKLRLVDLTTGRSLRRLSAIADARISTGSHAVSQRWAAAFWSHPVHTDGILYVCRRAPEFHSVALFDRVRPHLIANCDSNFLNDPVELAALLGHYDCALIP
jgi:hypothetical protein